MSAIVIDRLTKHFGDFTAVDGVSLDVPDGQLVAVLGPNGAGKTTTLEILEGFIAPTAGAFTRGAATVARAQPYWRVSSCSKGMRKPGCPT